MITASSIQKTKNNSFFRTKMCLLCVPFVVYSLQLIGWALLLKNGLIVGDWSVWRLALLITIMFVVVVTLILANNDDHLTPLLPILPISPWVLWLVFLCIYTFINWSLPKLMDSLYDIPFFCSYIFPVFFLIITHRE